MRMKYFFLGILFGEFQNGNGLIYSGNCPNIEVLIEELPDFATLANTTFSSSTMKSEESRFP